MDSEEIEAADVEPNARVNSELRNMNFNFFHGNTSETPWKKENLAQVKQLSQLFKRNSCHKER